MMWNTILKIKLVNENDFINENKIKKMIRKQKQRAKEKKIRKKG